MRLWYIAPKVDLTRVAILAPAAGRGVCRTRCPAVFGPPSPRGNRNVVPIAQLAEPPAGEAEFLGKRIEWRGPRAVVEPLAAEDNARHAGERNGVVRSAGKVRCWRHRSGAGTPWRLIRDVVSRRSARRSSARQHPSQRAADPDDNNPPTGVAGQEGALLFCQIVLAIVPPVPPWLLPPPSNSNPSPRRPRHHQRHHGLRSASTGQAKT